VKKFIPVVLTLLLLLAFLPTASAEKVTAKKEPANYQVPASVRNITKENTYPNSTQDLPNLQPSELTKKLIDSSKVKIENPDLIRMLNESSINSTPFAIGYRAIVYLGRLQTGSIKKSIQTTMIIAAAKFLTKFITCKKLKKLSVAD
jgi:hypothetical protein